MDDLQYRKWINASIGWNRSKVLNLVINGWPSILKRRLQIFQFSNILWVLNLVINGWPSILMEVLKWKENQMKEF